MSHRSQLTTRARTRWILAGAAAAFGVCTLGLLVRSSAQDAACYAGTGTTITCFRSGNPALASEVNRNFKNLADWIGAKVGGSAASGISTPSVAATGEVSAGSLKVSGSSALAAATLSSNLSVTGNVVVSGNLTVSGETSGASRYVVSAAYDSRYAAANVTSSIVQLDGARLLAMCGDDDGCLVRLVMADYDYGASSLAAQRRDASVGPYHFDFNSNGGFRMAEGLTTNSSEPVSRQTGVNGDNALTHALRAWNCFFTDSNYTVGAGSPVDAPDADASKPSMFLLNYNAETSYRPKCTLIIDD